MMTMVMLICTIYNVLKIHNNQSIGSVQRRNKDENVHRFAPRFGERDKYNKFFENYGILLGFPHHAKRFPKKSYLVYHHAKVNAFYIEICCANLKTYL